MKTLSYAFSSGAGAEGAALTRELAFTLVDSGGLKTLFPLFMKTPTHNRVGTSSGARGRKYKKKRVELSMSEAELEEHIITIVSGVVRGVLLCALSLLITDYWS